MRKDSILVAITIAGLMLLFSMPVFAIPIVELKPESQEVKLGEPVYVAIVISGLGKATAPSLGGFDLRFGFDGDDVLSVSGVKFGDPILGDQLNLHNDFPFTLFEPDQYDNSFWEIFEVSPTKTDINKNQTDSFTLATIKLDTIGLGLGLLSISEMIVNPPIVNLVANVTTSPPLSDADGNGFPEYVLKGSSIHVIPKSPTALPEPATLLLFGTGLAGLAGLSRKNLKKDN